MMMLDELDLIDPDKQEVRFRALRAEQPIGDLFIASIPHETLGKIAYFDVRRVLQEDRDIERYLGIQRPLNNRRVEELKRYVNYEDATFPTGIIIAVSDDYCEYDEDSGYLELRNYRYGEPSPSQRIRESARVIDGQHRIAGLYGYRGEKKFELPVVVFVGSDISDQAYVFATVNLEQTKVSKSLAYDLFELARTRSPQRTAHQIAVALDSDEASPFYRKIKRLGTATPGRSGEMITQATFVERLLAYISANPKDDRDKLLRGASLDRVDDQRSQLIFRNMFIDKRDIDIGRIVFSYFSAIRSRWPEAWKNRERGYILNKTNGFRALMRVLGPLYKKIAQPGNVPDERKFLDQLSQVHMDWQQFNTDNYAPGTSGESALRHDLALALGIDD